MSPRGSRSERQNQSAKMDFYHGIEIAKIVWIGKLSISTIKTNLN